MSVLSAALWSHGVRTPLTYYGGKQMLAKQIVPLMPAHRVYCEPFCGGAAILFAKPRAEREVLNDLDGQIVAFWRALRDRPRELADAIAMTPYSRAEWKASREEVAGDDVEAARRLLLNVDQSFQRSRDSWSTPCLNFDRRGRWQPGVWANLPPKIVAAATRLQGVAVEHRDALDLIPRLDEPGALLYVDPPYTGPHRVTMEKGYRHDDTEGLWLRLVEVLAGLKHAMVLLSGYPCEEADSLGWRRLDLERKRSSPLRADGTRPEAHETLWLSPNVPEPMPNLLEVLDVA